MIEMEENLTLNEVNLLAEASRNKEKREQRFLAALKGIDLDEKESTSSFEEVQKKAAAALAGQTEEEYVFNMIGIEYDKDED